MSTKSSDEPSVIRWQDEAEGHKAAAEPDSTSAPGVTETDEQGGHSHGHGWMMLACCVPMILVAGALVLSGVAGAGTIFFVLVCVAMMAAMMFTMPGHRR